MPQEQPLTNVEERAYRPETDFMAVRQMLIDTFTPGRGTRNWRIERWNYARYFVVPMFGNYRKDVATEADVAAAITFWESHNRVWAAPDGTIAAIVTFEYPWPGEAFLLRRPGTDFLLDQMLAYAEAKLIDPKEHTLKVNVYEHDPALQAAAAARGYTKGTAWYEEDSVAPVDPLPAVDLPAGFRLLSMADDNDIEARREGIGRGFNHTDPREWVSAIAYRELQQAPDYHPDLDLYIVAPDGRHASSCIVWWDPVNRHGVLEPVATHPDFRRLGLGRAVIAEGTRRAAARGATEMWVGASMPFYRAIGFEPQTRAYRWEKTWPE